MQIVEVEETVVASLKRTLCFTIPTSGFKQQRSGQITLLTKAAELVYHYCQNSYSGQDTSQRWSFDEITKILPSMQAKLNDNQMFSKHSRSNWLSKIR